MDTNNQNSSGMMNGMPPMPPEHEKKVGPIVGALIIVLMLIIAALYFFGQRLNKNSNPAQENNPAVNSQVTEGTNQASSGTAAVQSDNVQDLRKDLDNELKNIDYSF